MLLNHHEVNNIKYLISGPTVSVLLKTLHVSETMHQFRLQNLWIMFRKLDMAPVFVNYTTQCNVSASVKLIDFVPKVYGVYPITMHCTTCV